jgi:hypothetical protein
VRGLEAKEGREGDGGVGMGGPECGASSVERGRKGMRREARKRVRVKVRIRQEHSCDSGVGTSRRMQGTQDVLLSIRPRSWPLGDHKRFNLCFCNYLHL